MALDYLRLPLKYAFGPAGFLDSAHPESPGFDDSRWPTCVLPQGNTNGGGPLWPSYQYGNVSDFWMRYKFGINVSRQYYAIVDDSTTAWWNGKLFYDSGEVQAPHGEGPVAIPSTSWAEPNVFVCKAKDRAAVLNFIDIQLDVIAGAGSGWAAG